MASKPTQFDSLFQEAGAKHGVDPAILKAMASVESNFRPDAVGPRTRSGRAQGMMQFVPATAKAYGLDDPFDPAKSVDAAARLMRDNLKQFDGDLGKALEAYNGGPKLVGKSRQTAAYREKVMQRAQLARKDPKFKTQLAKTQTLPPMAGKSAPTSRQEMPDTSALPASYKAALALQYFTDTDPEGNPVESAEEELENYLAEMEYEQEAPAGGQTLAKAFAAQQENYVSPFDIMAGMQQPESVDQEPTRMAQVQGFADGGFVFGGTNLPTMPNWSLNNPTNLSPLEQRVLKQFELEEEAYNKKINDYNNRIKELQELEKHRDFARYKSQYENWAQGYNNYVNTVNDAIASWNKQDSFFEKWYRGLPNPNVLNFDDFYARYTADRFGIDKSHLYNKRADTFLENKGWDDEKIKQLDTLAHKILSSSVQKADTYIITNAEPGWVEYSAERFYPKVFSILNKVN